MQGPTFYTLPAPVAVDGLSYEALGVGQYIVDGSLALFLPHADPSAQTVISVYIASATLEEGEFCLNVNSSYAKALARGLLTQGIISPTDKEFPSGFVTYPVYTAHFDGLTETELTF